MDPHRALLTVSAAQLGAGVAGLAIAVSRRHHYDVLWLRGDRDHVARDSILMGTAFSAPATMLVAQVALTLRAMRGEGPRAARGLSVLGASMVAGYLGERLVRHRLTPSGWDRLESPLVLAGVSLAAAMAIVGAAASGTRGRRLMSR